MDAVVTFKRSSNSFHARCRATGDGACGSAAGGAEQGSGWHIFCDFFRGIFSGSFGSNLDSRLCNCSTVNRDS